MTVQIFSIDNTKQNSSDNLPSYLLTNITAQMLSIRGEGINWTQLNRSCEHYDKPPTERLSLV